MKKKLTIPLLLAAIIVLGGAYLGLTQYNKSQDKKAEEKKEAATDYLLKDASFTKIGFSCGDQGISFTKDDDEWYYTDDENIPITQSTVQAISSAFSDLPAVNTFDEPDALSDYGLENPTYTVELTEDDQTEVKLLVGNATGENYYIMKDGEDTVYTIASGVIGYLDPSLSSYVENDITPSISSSNLVKVVVEKNGKTVFEDKDEDDMASLSGGFGAITLSDPVNYDASAEDLTSYGLDEGNRMTITATYTDDDNKNQTFTLYAGKSFKASDSEENENDQYVMVEGSKMVYAVNKELVTNMMTVQDE